MAEAYFYTSRDFVEVVRCRECKNLRLCGGNTVDSSYNWCVHFKHHVKPDDFCSYGEAEKEDE